MSISLIVLLASWKYIKSIYYYIVVGTSMIIELEGRAGSLEKNLATKESYIKDLEDIIVEKVIDSLHSYLGE